MTTIVTRSGKGSALSWDEVDANFTNLNTDKAETNSPTFTGTVNGITKAMVGLGNADNTSDVNKPISTATQSSLDLKVSKDSSVGAAQIPSGNTSQRPTPVTGDFRYNTQTLRWEGYNGSVWEPIDNVASGAMQFFFMNSAPVGWLVADGSLVSRTTYASLFSAIGTTFGSGDGSTTFQLPDMRGYFPRGSGTNGDGTTSGTFGAKQVDTIIDHSHGSAAAPSGAQILTAGAVGAAANGSSTGTVNSPHNGGTETRPRNIALLCCVKI